MKDFLVLLAFLAVATGGADVSGKWSGTGKATLKDGSPLTGTLFLVLQQHEDGRTTGSAGCDEESAKPIENVKMDGSKIFFEMTNPRDGVVTRFELRLVDQDRLEGESACVVAGEHRRMALSMRRIKPSVRKPTVL